MTEISLTPRLTAKLEILFNHSDRPLAKEWLLSECGRNDPSGLTNQAWVERVRAAALKFSGGSLDKLAQAMALGKEDWRDLLMASEFSSLNAHEEWLNEP